MSAEGAEAEPGFVPEAAEAAVVPAAVGQEPVVVPPALGQEPGARAPEAAVDSTTTDTADGEVGEDEDDEKDAVVKADVKLELSITNEYDKVSFAETREDFLMMASLKAPYFRSEDRAPIDLIAVVDESGSMRGERIKLVKETVSFIIDNLESNDRFAIVGYQSSIRDVLSLEKMTADGKAKAHRAAETLKAGGGTALCGGLLRGVELMRQRKAAARNEVAAVMLFTDGQATTGPTSSAGIIQALKDLASGKGPAIGGRMKKKKMKKKGKMPKKAEATTTATAAGTGEVQGEEEAVADLSCVVNTFGFGAGHKAALLQDIADFGRGMYAFIETGDEIADTFAECLGGLVSTVAQNIKVTVEAMSAEVAVGELLSKGFSKKTDEFGKVVIEMKDIQSEEKRDLLFYMKVPSIRAPSAEYPLAKVTVAYNNCVRELDEEFECATVLERCGDDVAIGERNYELDLQLNRILAAKAMEAADRHAEAGRLEEARTTLTAAEKQISGSQSAASDYSQKLVSEMKTVRGGLRDKRMYEAHTSKVMKMSSKAHYAQRAVHSSAMVSQEAYVSRKKKGMKRKFKKKS